MAKDEEEHRIRSERKEKEKIEKFPSKNYHELKITIK